MIRRTQISARSILTLGLCAATCAATFAPAHAQFVPTPVEDAPTANTGAPTAPTPHDAALMQAVKAGNAEAALEALALGASVDARDAEGKTPLMWAAGKGRTDLVRALIEKGAQVSATDLFGRSALHYVLAAAPSTSPSTLEAPKKKKRLGGFLKSIGQGVASGAISDLSGDALKNQLQSRLSRELGQSLLGQNLASLLNGGSFDLSNSRAWGAILGSASSGGKGSGALHSILSGDLTRMDASGWVSLVSSAGRSNPQVLEAMSKLGPAVDAAQARDWSRFLDMASKGNAAGVREMIESGNIAPLLQQAGAALSQAADMIPGRDGGASIARALLEGGADASLADRAGQTALQHAQKRGLGPVIEMLQSPTTTR